MGKLVVEVSGASDSGIIYIQGQGENCRLMTSSSLQSYEFDFEECGIQWEMIMRVIIQQKSGYQTGNDKTIPVLCIADTSDLIASNILAAQKEDNFGLNLTTRPEVTMRFFKALSDEEVIGSEIKLSDKLIMSLQLDSEYTDDFDIKAKYCSASGIPLIGDYCTLDDDLFPNFWKLRQGHLLSEFGAFRPTSLEGGAVLINFTCVVKLCQGYCSPSICNDVYNGQGRRKRSDEVFPSRNSSEESNARFKRQSEVEDLLDIGRTIKVVEKYSDISKLSYLLHCYVDAFSLI
ncbi:hypothetical protein FSP39_013030 [Pinctada imbricata]|uniref:ZP domain-containing protein n=1 Tax=Pinctada imbricata TaxID=66713 RepID=A0AA88Y3M5_PINIB|nr:hypothetical protein FSP39_013030 [Pinctada imbricata]